MTRDAGTPSDATRIFGSRPPKIAHSGTLFMSFETIALAIAIGSTDE
jgi:hypothetical protein